LGDIALNLRARLPPRGGGRNAFPCSAATRNRGFGGSQKGSPGQPRGCKAAVTPRWVSPRACPCRCGRPSPLPKSRTLRGIGPGGPFPPPILPVTAHGMGLWSLPPSRQPSHLATRQVLSRSHFSPALLKHQKATSGYPHAGSPGPGVSFPPL